MASSLGIWESAWGYVGATIFLAALSSLLVALRFWSRYISGLGVHWDDWLALVTLLVHHGLGATILIAFISDGLGFPMVRLAKADPRAAMGLQKLTFIGTVLYGAGSTSVRLSVIIFYFRIFPTTAVRRGGYILVGICAAWFIAIEALNLATCTPIAYMWDPTIPGGHCITAPAGVIVLGAFNVIIDAVTVALPIHEVIKLNLSREKKVIIFGVFLIGGMCVEPRQMMQYVPYVELFLLMPCIVPRLPVSRASYRYRYTSISEQERVLAVSAPGLPTRGRGASERLTSSFSSDIRPPICDNRVRNLHRHHRSMCPHTCPRVQETSRQASSERHAGSSPIGLYQQAVKDAITHIWGQRDETCSQPYCSPGVGRRRAAL